jgi:hypothetical protein
MPRTWAVAVFLLAGWLFAALCVQTDGLGDFFLRHRYLPALPTVAAPYDPTTDVVSVVPFLFRAVLCSGVAAVIAGGGKMLLAISGRATPLSYVALTAAQAVLFGDVFRALAPDWTVYAAHVVRLITLSEQTYLYSRRVSWGAPWISLAVCVVSNCIVIWHVRRIERVDAQLE